MAVARFPKAAYRRQLKRMEDNLREWAAHYAAISQSTDAEWIQGKALERFAQLRDIAGTLERARYDLDVLPRLS